MGGKSKGEDRNEKMIRYLLKLPENRRCINCSSLGPQYVCTTFWTFICTNCSGVHREFTHRVKSVSMAKFGDEEVNVLQAGGNERARQTFLKTWDTSRNSLPHNNNTNKLREFIKHVYEERRYTGDINRFARLTMSEKDDPYKPKYSERNNFCEWNDDKNYRLSREEMSTSLRENPRHGPNPSEEFKIDDVDERYLERNAHFLRRSATEMFTTADFPKDKYLSVHSNSRGVSIPPISHSIQELLGKNVPKLQVEVKPKSNRRKPPNTLDNIEKFTSPKMEASSNESTAKNRSTNSESLIDFTTQPEPPLVSGGVKDKGISSSKPDENEVAHKVSHKNTLEFLLFELASPATPPHNNDNSALATSPISEILTSNNELALYNQDMVSTPTPKSEPSHSLESESHIPTDLALVPIESAHVLQNAPFSTLYDQDMVSTPTPNSESSHFLESEFPIPTNFALVPIESAHVLQNAPFSPIWLNQNNVQENFHPMSIEGITRPDQNAPSQSMEISFLDPMRPNYASTSMSMPWCCKNITQSEQNSTGNRANTSISTTQKSTDSQQCDNLTLVPLSSTSSLAAQPINPFVGVSKNQPKTLNQKNHGEAQQAANFSPSTKSTFTQPKSTQRTEIPFDLFSSLSSPGPRGPLLWWQNDPYNNMGYNMPYQHPSFMQGSTLTNPPKSTNPFDINIEFNQGQPNTFPAMASMQEEPNNRSNPREISSTSFGAYMGQNFYNNMSFSSQGSFDNNATTETLGSNDKNQQSTYRNSAPPSQSSSSSKGFNPFA